MNILSVDLAAPTSVSISNSLGTTSIESGTTIIYSCTSTGGNPSPTVEFYIGDGAWSVREIGPTITHSFTVEESMHSLTMMCRAVNTVGEKTATETLAVFSELEFKGIFIPLKAPLVDIKKFPMFSLEIG